jgi:alkanesulfonate monooxygenase SsuD/methylene tetrahydromethanopterin reductase-like flavin-dependent oxidoreductase (luciferase family)
MQFGVTVLPDPPYTRLVELVALAEKHGFHSGWTYDSPILWQEPYPLVTLLADRTSTMMGEGNQ